MAIAPVSSNGVPVQGQISTPDTVDLHSTSLMAGEPYRFVAQGATSGKGTLADPNLAIGKLDASGNFAPITGSQGGSSGVSYTPPVTRAYVAGVGSAIPHGTGTYTLTVAHAVV
jgi:hypothetical protein